MTSELVYAHACAAVEAIAPDSTSALAWLRERLALSETEVGVLWLVIAHELCPRIRRQLRDLATEDVADPTLDVVQRVVYTGDTLAKAWLELAEEAPLRRLGLVERTDGDAAAPRHRRTFAASGRTLALVFGNRGVDPEVARLAPGADPELALDDLEVEPACIEQLTSGIGARRLVIVRGAPGAGRRSLCVAALRAHGLEPLVVDGRRIAGERADVERRLRAVARECVLHERVPVIVHLDALRGELDLVEAELSGRVLATSATVLARRWLDAPITVELPPPSASRCAALWARALPEASADDAALLATIHPLSPALIHAVGAAAVASCRGGAMRPSHIAAGLRAVLDDRFAGLARRVEVTQCWDDLVLPNDQTTALVELLARIRHRRRVFDDWGFARKLGRGLGVTALFSGPPGTGKTMCAGLIARDLGTELYQVDLSAVSSKWIGETEKNLAALFDNAEAAHAVLLFDEADALFARRTEVRTSTDRHANQQVDYLLQRLETFTGTCILTTNHETAIDSAYLRRLAVHVRFSLPDAAERARLWGALLPTSAPVAAELGLGQLADKFAMSGGYIRNAVLRAAFLAADAATPITADHLARAARLEYEAMGKLA